ncbi:MAG: GMC family oxidoreductase [Parvularculaceae bacterium]
MFTDARTLADGAALEAEICVIGCGAAGLTLARQLEGSDARIIFLERGGFEYDEATQALYRGENAGRDYFDLDATRLRFFGGSTNHWGGRCLPFEPLDFERRAGVAHSGWPIPYSSLRRYYEIAHEVITLGAFDYDVKAQAEALEQKLLPFDSSAVRSVLTRNKPLRFGEHYRELVARSEHMNCLLWANCTGFLFDEGGENLTAAELRTLDGKQARVSAKLFVLATGGIENARLLLLPNDRRPRGIGNTDDQAGRYFMEHLLYSSGLIVVNERDESYDLYADFLDAGADELQATLALNPEIVRRERLANVYFELQAQRGYGFTDAFASGKHLARSFRELDWPDGFFHHIGAVLGDLDSVVDGVSDKLRGRPLLHGDAPLAFRVYNFGEQLPNPDSRVGLAETRDPFGSPRVRLDWRITEADLESIRRGHEILAREVGRSGLGRMRINLDFDSEPPLPSLRGGHHHMGATRMSETPTQGVVDAHCRVHDVGNLYVAGSSVFPTSGFANPTLTIVALAARLADRLKAELHAG